jgi:23S rRNA (guanosine2251-2'-O)-methyltransferase
MSRVLIYGINPVAEALRAGRARELIVAQRIDERVARMVREAGQSGLPVRRVSPADLDRLARGGVHQGIAASLHPRRAASLENLVTRGADVPLLVVLDGVEDPHNVGAIIRTADAAGVHGLVRQARRAAALDGAAAKASAGAFAHLRLATVVNIARAIEELKDLGVWTVGLAGDAAEPYDRVDFTLPTALVFGAEGTGLRRLVRDRCDRLVSIPMQGAVSSLNVSVAAGVTLFEAVRQRRIQRAAAKI